jgi:hypothetical protein
VNAPFRVRRRQRNRAVLAASVLGLAVAAAVTWLVIRYASSHPDDVRIGDRLFEVGQASRLAGPIERQGPLLFKDPLNRGRELYLQHLGGDVQQGWLAFEAYAPESPREPRCQLRWLQPARRFLDECSGRTYGADGGGLRSYPATVDDRGTVVVDLRSPAGAGEPLGDTLLS